MKQYMRQNIKQTIAFENYRYYQMAKFVDAKLMLLGVAGHGLYHSLNDNL